MGDCVQHIYRRSNLYRRAAPLAHQDDLYIGATAMTLMRKICDGSPFSNAAMRRCVALEVLERKDRCTA
jgi:hypothetical protein